MNKIQIKITRRHNSSAFKQPSELFNEIANELCKQLAHAPNPRPKHSKYAHKFDWDIDGLLYTSHTFTKDHLYVVYSFPF